MVTSAERQFEQRQHTNPGYYVRPRINVKRKQKSMSAKDRKHAMLLLLVCGLIGILFVISTAYAAAINYTNNQLEEENAALSGEIETMKVEIESAANIATVESEATEELGMKYAEGDNYVIISGDEETNNNFAAKLKEKAFD